MERTSSSRSGAKKVMSDFERTYAQFQEVGEEFKWTDKMLSENQIHRITDEFYDSEVYKREGKASNGTAPWIIVFTKDRFNQAPNAGWNELNFRLFQSMWELK